MSPRAPRKPAWFAVLVVTALASGHFVPAQIFQTTEEWVCPPCGCADHEIKSEAGACPDCGMTLIPRSDLVDLAVFAYPRFSLAESLDTVRTLQASGQFYSYTVALTEKPIVTREQLKIAPAYTTVSTVRPGVLVIPGGSVTLTYSEDPRLHEWLKAASAEADQVIAIGMGSALLMQAGLLDGAEVAVSANQRQVLLRMGVGQKSTLRDDAAWVRSGRFVTVADPESDVDAALSVVSEVLGRATARTTAQRVGRSDWSPRN